MADAFHQAVLQRVAEGAMADVVQEDGDVRAERLFIADRVTFRAQRADGLPHEVHGAQRMVEARVQRSGVDQVRKTELLDVTQTLEPGMVDQPQHHRMGHGDEPVDGVVQDLAAASQGLVLGCWLSVEAGWSERSIGRLAADNRLRKPVHIITPGAASRCSVRRLGEERWKGPIFTHRK